MNKITLPSGTYAIDDILLGFDIIEKPSLNVAFVGRDFVEHRIYVQFKNGSAYMYIDVDYDTMSFIPAAESIGKFISSSVVKKFPCEKLESALIVSYNDFNGFPDPVLVITGDVKNFPKKSEPGVITHVGDAEIEYIEPQPDKEPEF